MQLVFDIETDGLYFHATKIWCLVAVDENNKVYSFTPNKIKEGIELLKSADKIIGHNIIGFDIPVVNKFFGSDLFKNCKITDTLVLSRLLNPILEGGHSLKNWGTKLGQSKIEFEQFDYLSDDMLKYCRNDVALTEKL